MTCFWLIQINENTETFGDDNIVFALITITTATFLILHSINKLIATKLTQNDRAALFIVFVLVVLRVIKEISKETLFNKIEVAVGAVHLGWFFIKYAVLMFLYFITSLLMNLGRVDIIKN